MQIKEKVFILRKIRFGESDLILNCLTQTGSRVNLIARGALKSKKRFGGGVLEPTHYVTVLYDDKASAAEEGRLCTLKEATLIEGFEGLRTDYSRIEAGLYFVRLVSEVVREGDLHSADLFNLLGNTLRAAQTSVRLDRLRSQFEVKLLSNQGVLPVNGEEEVLLRTPIADHERIRLDESTWNQIRFKVSGVLRDYLEHSRFERD